MEKITSQKFTDLILASALIIWDRLAKIIFLVTLTKDKEIILIKDFFSLKLIFNEGAIFSLNVKLWILIFGTVIILGVLGLFYGKYYRVLNNPERFGLVAVFAGALGNLLDRVLVGGVVDYLNPSFWAAFNLADIFIVCGVILVIIGLFSRKSR